MVDCYPNIRENISVKYISKNINALLGTNISDEYISKYLSAVGIRTENNIAYPPTFRADVTCEADLAEEVARIHGYDNIPSVLGRIKPSAGIRTDRQRFADNVKNTLSSLGFYEMLSYSFESGNVFEKLLIPENSPLREAITVLNPLSEDFSHMRTTTVNAVLTSLAYNSSRRNPAAALFEIAKTYVAESLPLTKLPDEHEYLTLGMYGNCDFFCIKGAVEATLAAIGINADYQKTDILPFMHPTRSAFVLVNGVNIGFLGEIHPLVAENYDIKEKTYISVLDFGLIYDNSPSSLKISPLPKFPSVKRDIALIVDEGVTAGELFAAIRIAGGETLENVSLFDVYTGTGVPNGKKSMAFNLYYRALEKTLTDAEIIAVTDKILTELNEKTGAELRR
jgi:phenylalanyl-tRNA synthetase beta chain